MKTHEPLADPETRLTLPLEAIAESPWNPRTQFDAQALSDLQASILTHGVLVPLLVRPVNGHYELVDGARRFRAAALAGLTEVPVIVRALDDLAAREAGMVANLQRADVHPLEEAAGYESLMAIDRAYTPEAIAAKVGKSVSYVHQRLSLTRLVPDVRQAWLEDRVTAGHALEIAKLAADVQVKALDACFRTLWNEIEPNDPKNLVSLRELKEWVKEHTKLDLTDPDTAALFPEAVDAVLAAAGGERLLEVTSDYQVPKELQAAGVLPVTKYRRVVTAKDRCVHTRAAVVVHGRDAGEVYQVCANKKCAQHFPPAQKPAHDAPGNREAEKQEREAKAAVWARIRPFALAIVVAKTKTVKPTQETLEDLVSSVAYSNVDDVVKAVGGKVTTANIWRALAIAEAYDDAYTIDQFGAIAKKYGIDLKKLEREHGQADAPATQDTPKKGSGARPVTTATAKAAPKKAPAKKVGKKR